MPAPSPPPSPLPPSHFLPSATTSLTSSQCHQQASCHQKHNQHVIGSPEQYRTPAIPSNISASTSVSHSITFNGQVYNHLPANLAAQLAALPPIAGPSRPRHSTIVTSHQILNPAQLAAAYSALPPLYPLRNSTSVSCNSFSKSNYLNIY